MLLFILVSMIPSFDQIIHEIPNDFEQSMKSLKDSFRISLILLFLKRDHMHLSEIATLTNKENSVLLNHLKKLELPGIIQNFIQKQPGIKEYSFYELTNYGRFFFKHLVQIYNEFYNIKGNSIEKVSVPDDLIDNLKALSSKLRFALSLVLYEPSSFSDLVKKTNIEKSNLVVELKKLESGGIIQNFLQKKAESKEYSFYEATNWAKKLTRGLMDTYNQFYLKKETEADKIESTSKIESFTLNSANWALPREPILAWMAICSEEIQELKIFLTKNLTINSFFNTQATFDDSLKQYSIVLSDKRKKYLPFELHSEIPTTDEIVNTETITVKALNAKAEIIQQQVASIEIIKPVVKLKVIQEKISKDKGFFRFTLTFSTNIQITSPGIQFKVTDQFDHLINIHIKEKDPSEIEQELPSGVQFENLLGGFTFSKVGIYKFYFRIPFKDLQGNEYFSNEEIVTLNNSTEFNWNFNYCVQQTETIVTG